MFYRLLLLAAVASACRCFPSATVSFGTVLPGLTADQTISVPGLLAGTPVTCGTTVATAANSFIQYFCAANSVLTVRVGNIAALGNLGATSLTVRCCACEFNN